MMWITFCRLPRPICAWHGMWRQEGGEADLSGGQAHGSGGTRAQEQRYVACSAIERGGAGGVTRKLSGLTSR